MALLRRRFKLYGEPYDQQLFDYINGTKYPTNEQWLVMNNIVAELPPGRDKNGIKPLILYRGSDYPPLLDLTIGDTIKFEKRFYSWTDKLNVAKEVVDFNGVIFVWTIPLNDKEYGIDLRKVNQLQKEVLIPPISFYIIDIVFDNKIKYLYVDRKF